MEVASASYSEGERRDGSTLLSWGVNGRGGILLRNWASWLMPGQVCIPSRMEGQREGNHGWLNRAKVFLPLDRLS
ncbi:hypothetical protein VTK73DRAFT_2152 [Phialemonium thermophilum]|uniref:Uncharacterized protein n=1 Tax=Phialemonium thermophilum TaxID=223376 RepID=A0ABR3VSI3_9PEZI